MWFHLGMVLGARKCGGFPTCEIITGLEHRWSGRVLRPTRPDDVRQPGSTQPLLWEGTTMSHRSSASIWSRPSERYSVTCNTNSIQMQGTHRRASLAPPAECQAGRRSKHGVPNKTMGPTGQPEGGGAGGLASCRTAVA